MSRKSIWQPDADEKLNQIKDEICRVVDREMVFTQRTQKELARRLCTSQANISRVMNRKVDELTFNQLFRYLAVLNPNFRILIANY